MGSKDFKIIMFTTPDLYPGEDDLINSLLSSGAIDIVHIRKPGLSLTEVRDLVESIDIRWRNRIKLNGHFALTDDYNLCGVHLNSRCKTPPITARNISKSMHSLSELKDARNYDYVTLSPIFDSISKSGYKANFSLQDLKGKLPQDKVIALGGISPDKFPVLKETGFAGAALLGYIYNSTLDTVIEEIKKYR